MYSVLPVEFQNAVVFWILFAEEVHIFFFCEAIICFVYITHVQFFECVVAHLREIRHASIA